MSCGTVATCDTSQFMITQSRVNLHTAAVVEWRLDFLQNRVRCSQCLRFEARRRRAPGDEITAARALVTHECRRSRREAWVFAHASECHFHQLNATQKARLAQPPSSCSLSVTGQPTPLSEEPRLGASCMRLFGPRRRSGSPRWAVVTAWAQPRPRSRFMRVEEGRAQRRKAQNAHTPSQASGPRRRVPAMSARHRPVNKQLIRMARS